MPASAREIFSGDRQRIHPNAKAAQRHPFHENAAHNSAKSQHEREQIEQHWKAYIQAAQNGSTAGQPETWRPKQPAP